MGLETGKPLYPSELNADWPLSGDQFQEGDDHLRLIKDTLQSSMSNVITPSTFAVDQNDYAPTGLDGAFMLRLEATAAANITGLTGGIAGRWIAIQNIAAFTITLTAEDAGSTTAANRFGFAQDVPLESGNLVLIWYDGTTSRWKLLGGDGHRAANQDWSGSQRSAFVALADDVGDIDLATGQNFTVNQVAAASLELDIINAVPNGQTGLIKVIANGSGITGPAPIEWGDAGIGTAMDAAGTYMLSYAADGTKVYMAMFVAVTT